MHLLAEIFGVAIAPERAGAATCEAGILKRLDKQLLGRVPSYQRAVAQFHFFPQANLHA